MQALMDQLAALEQQAATEVLGAANPQDVQALRAKFLGRKGLLTDILRRMGGIVPTERPLVGRRANALKDAIEAALARRTAELQAQDLAQSLATHIDVTLPGRGPLPGHPHPIVTTLAEITAIFAGLGFSVCEGPEVERDSYNFAALNMPPNHPARDMHDTFYLGEGPLLLRTHTSPVQIRVMERQPPPVRMIAPGAAYRRDAVDATHSPMFHQVEGLYVDAGVTFGNLKGVLTVFLHRLFGGDIPVRFRPSFFPFTEPSAEVDVGCMFCRGVRGRSCRICKGSGWLEILGAGMVDPEVFRYVKYDPAKVSGFAFGLGVERVAMLKYGIDDIRLFYSGDVRFLEQF